MSLANGNVGQALLYPLLADDTLPRLSREVIRPFYRARSEFAVGVLGDALGEALPWALHAREGAFFLWLWLKNLRIPAAELYQRLKAREVLVIPGHYFAPGLDAPWAHASPMPEHHILAARDRVVREGLEILAEEARACSAV